MALILYLENGGTLLIGDKVHAALLNPEDPDHEIAVYNLRDASVSVDLEFDQRQFDKLVKAITLREKPIEPHIPQIGIGRRRGKGERKKNRADRWR